MTASESRVITPLPASHPELGRWLWAFEDTRARTKETLARLDQKQLDWSAPGIDNSIGSLLYHIALIEADYLYADTLGVDYPDWLEELLPWSDRDSTGHLTVVTGVSLEEHLARLDRIRTEFLKEVAALTVDQVNAPRLHPDNYLVSPAWVLHHLMQHEAEHRGQITAIVALQGT